MTGKSTVQAARQRIGVVLAMGLTVAMPASVLLTADTIAGQASPACENEINGTNGRDTIEGTPEGDLIRGRGGADQLIGFAGKDCIYGGRGGDMVQGGADRDRLYGLGGNDDLAGSADEDKIRGGAGADRLQGGNQSDVLRDFSKRRDVFNCGWGSANEQRDIAYLRRSDYESRLDEVNGCEVVRFNQNR